MANVTGKIVEVFFENALKTHDEQMQLLPLCNFSQPDPATLQNAGNFIWKTVQQHAPIIEGVDLTGLETGIIEETYPCVLGTPKNDFVKQLASDSRDMGFWKRRGEQSGMRQVSELNQKIATAIALQGSLFVRSNATSGYPFIAEGQALLNERQSVTSKRCFILNDRDTLTYSADLAARQTLQGRPAETWNIGQIGRNVASFDVYTGSFLPNLPGGAAAAVTVTGAQSFAPEAGTVSATGVVTDVDYRIASVPVSASASFNIGDKVEVQNGGVAIQSLGLMDKTETGQSMTFTIVGKPDATTIQIYPKPIAADDAALSTLEKAYANVDTTMINLATVVRLNIDATNKTNLFFEKDSIEITGGTIPAELFKEFAGMKVMSEQMPNGQTMYMMYDGNIATLSFRYRLFTWYGITVANPQACGVAVSF